MTEQQEMILYDADCRRCRDLARRWAPALGRRGFRLAPLPDSGQPPAEMQVRTRDGRLLGGADGLLYLARGFWWARPLRLAAKVPALLILLRRAYDWIADHRHTTRRWPGWLPLATAPVAVLSLRAAAPPWVFMWLLALAIFGGFKWQTWWPHRSNTPWARSAAYLLAWPGMDAVGFLNDSSRRPRPREWAAAAFKALLGAALVWGVARLAPTPLLAGWIGMAGLGLLLHFGIFHLLALAWQSGGAAVHPMMNAPLAARSPSDFWGRRWNLAFRLLSHDLVFRPLRRRAGTVWAALGTFAGSGLLHDLVISLPAGSGYGLPTAYFLLQGLGVVVERSTFGRRCGLGQGYLGRLFALLLVAVPLPWLFHRPFVTRVMVPFLEALNAL